MKQFTCLIADDQEEAIDLINDHIEKIPVLKSIFSSTKPYDVLNFLENIMPDIIFLDIQMPDLSGIDLIETIKERWGNNIPKIVLVTGYIDYTLSGYELGVEDYILKPVTFKRFKKSVDRIIDNLNKQILIKHIPEFCFIDVGNNKKLKVNFEDIIYIEGARNYIIIITEVKKHIIYRSMKSMETILPENKFIRIHKSFFIAIDKIIAMQAGKIIVKYKNEDVRLPVGVTYKKDLFTRLNI